MAAVEVCPICDIAGCRHIRERKASPVYTQSQLDEAVRAARADTWEEAASDMLRFSFDHEQWVAAGESTRAAFRAVYLERAAAIRARGETK